MEHPPLDMKRVRELLAAVRENELGPEQSAELDALVDIHPEVRQHVARSMYLHAAMLWRGNGLTAKQPVTGMPVAGTSDAPPRKENAAPLTTFLGSIFQQSWNAAAHPSQHPLLAVALSTLTVAVMLAVIFAPAWFRGPAPVHEPGVVAR